jgi:hypothetical protein
MDTVPANYAAARAKDAAGRDAGLDLARVKASVALPNATINEQVRAQATRRGPWAPGTWDQRAVAPFDPTK